MALRRLLAKAIRAPAGALKYVHQHMDTQMPSRNLAVKEEVYRKLLEAKRGGESFSEVIGRLLQGKSDLMAFAGALAGDKEFEKVLEDIQKVRNRTVLRS